MILAIDVGNTNIVLGTIENGEIDRIVRIHTALDETAAEYGIKFRQLLDDYEIDPHCFEGAIISSVVPPVTGAIREAVKRLTGVDCMVVGPGMKTGLNVRIDDPATLAADLVVGSVAAIACYGAPAIVLDLGTATTMVVVDEKGSYRGGSIMPGIKLGLQALSEGTSLLPDISVTAPKKVIGTNTVDAMRSGAVYATASMIDGMIERMEEELGYKCKVIASGGFSRTVTACCRKEIICDEDLLLKGLWVLYQKNRK
ncbi:MAG: type III pantothenate kinase [Oscillospiraceae bacterium]|nr:type III pantothenate kinase [Oscillospiraceae bacterium]